MLMLLLTDIGELYQLLKLPILFEHFSEHKRIDNSVSFTDFLGMHYWGTDINDDDDARDQQLPYKKADVHLSQSVFLHNVSLTVLDNNISPIKKEFSDYKHIFFPDRALASPFRPPCA